jgi:hypothetical protein
VQPWLSVVIPTYNGAAHLEAALAGVRSQRDAEIEIIALDDGSTDATLDILAKHAREMPLRIVPMGRRGNWVANTNHGITLARGGWISILHQDDVWLPGRLNALRTAIGACPDATLVLHPAWYIDGQGCRLGPWSCPFPAREGVVACQMLLTRLLIQNFIAMPAPLFRKDAALRVGAMNDTLWYTADWDFWLRLAATGSMIYIPRRLAAFRLHPHSLTISRSVSLDDFRQQMTGVLDAHLPSLSRPPAEIARIERVARFSIEINTALAARVHGVQADWGTLTFAFLRLGPSGWHRFVRDSRITERVGARLRARLAVRRPTDSSRAASAGQEALRAG